MSSLARLVVYGMCFMLTGCGFQPMYGAKKGEPEISIAGVSVETSAGSDRRMSQQLKFDLEDKLNPAGAVPAHPMYRLSVSLKSSVGGIGVARDGTVSRYNVYLNSQYTLYRNGEKEPVAEGKLQHVSSYNNLVNQYYSTYVSEQDAMKRGVTELAELYRQRLSPYLAVN